MDRKVFLFFAAMAAIASPVWPFVVAAVRAARNKVANMATLIVLSVGTGYLFSVGATFFYESEVCFEALAVLLVFILLGHWLEMRARAGASDAIRALMDLAPPMAHRGSRRCRDPGVGGAGAGWRDGRHQAGRHDPGRW